LDEDIYNGKNPVDLPRYTYRDAGRATGVPATTIAAWFRGQAWHKGKSAGFFRPVLQRPDFKDPRLSYNNVLEVHILRALRTTHEIRLEKVREAILTAQRQYSIPRLLLSNQLYAGGGELFLTAYSELVHLSSGNQTVMRDLFVQYLKRITVQEAETDLLAFYPFPKNPALGTQKLILVSPHVAFGAAVISRLGVSTATIASRVNAGEERASIVEDYGLLEDEFDEAVLYEAA
jgi:uncharacterized protein (DUF433 family)